MIEVLVTKEFEKHYQKLPVAIQKNAERKEQICKNEKDLLVLNKEVFTSQRSKILRELSRHSSTC